MTTLPDDPRLGRQRAMAAYLRACMVAVLVLAAVVVVVPERLVDDVGAVMVAVLILAPVGRLVWLLVRWLRRGDRRFALVALLLLGVMAAALLV